MLFIYGTLQDADILAAVLGRPVETSTLRRATAPGYRAVHYPGRVYPALVAAPGNAAPGQVLDDLHPFDWEMLDAFEGKEYRREMIAVAVDQATVQAHAYLPTVPLNATAPRWSLDDWTLLHKPALLAAEQASAAALRHRLSRP